MNVRYTWYILGANGALVLPPPYADEYGDKYSLEPCDSEYEALKSLDVYTAVWDFPYSDRQFTLVKTYERY